MENQTLTKVIEELKNAGIVHSDADFCRKTGFKPSFVSEMKAGKKPFTAKSMKIIEETFPDFFHPKTVIMGDDSPTLGDVARMVAEHDRRFHDQMERIMDAMGMPEHREKSA